MPNIQQIIVDAAQRHNVPVEALLAIAKIESGFDPNAQNPNSSASGPFQFTDETAKEYGLVGDKRNDVAAQADAAARMLQTNARSLTKTLGRAPSAGELYLAHQQGLTGARALLANPDQTAAQALSSIYGNRSASVVRQNGGDPNAKASQFASQWVNKGNSTARMFPPGELPSVGTALSTVPTPPATPMPPIPKSRPDPVERSFARLPQPTPSNVSDQLALSPIRGAGVPSLNAGGYSGPAFNSSYARNDSPDYARSGAIPAKGALPQTVLPPVPASRSGGLHPFDASRTSPQSRPAQPMSYAGQERAPRPSAFGGDPGTRANGSVVAEIPTVTPRQAPVPASPYDRVTARLNAQPVITRLPEIPPSTLGQPPATRTVQSVPVPSAPRNLPGPSNPMPMQQRLALLNTDQPAVMTEKDIGGWSKNSPSGFVFKDGITPVPESMLPVRTPDTTPQRLAQAVYPTLEGGLPPLPSPVPTADQIHGATGFRGPASMMPPMPFARPNIMPPMPYARPQRQAQQMPPMPRQRPNFLSQQFAPQAMPQQQRAPLRVTINGGNVQQPRQMTPVQQFQSQGYSPSQAYEAANQAAVERAISNARDPEAARRLNSR